MKKTILLLIFSCQSVITIGQAWCGGIASPEEWNFDNSSAHWSTFLIIDTITNPDNIWQVGTPQKTVINSAYSSPNVIITDTINPYPANDTSVFIFNVIDHGGYAYAFTAELSGYYKVNSDTLKDYGMIEVSLDNGAYWFNITSDSCINCFPDEIDWFTPKPILTGNSDGWVNIRIDLSGLGAFCGVNYGDTIIYKFTFISDSIVDTLDGLAFDDIQFCDGWEGVNENTDNNFIDIYPNPASEKIFLSRKTNILNESVKIYSHIGNLILEDNHFEGNSIDIKKLNLANGIYFIEYYDTKNFIVKKIVVQN
jgi:hypothetical protein